MTSFEESRPVNNQRLRAGGAVRGVRFRGWKEPNGHNDNNWGRITNERGGENCGYGDGRRDVSHLFSLGTVRFTAEVWRPAWISLEKITYQTQLELYFDESIWDPGGIAWSGSVWGWYHIWLVETKLWGGERSILLAGP